MLLAEELQEVLSTRFLALKVAPEPDWEAAEAHPTRGIQLHRILSQPPEGWQGTAGHIAPPLLKELMPPPGPGASELDAVSNWSRDV